MSPELMSKREYSIYSDVWSFGVTIYEIVEQHTPYQGTFWLYFLYLGMEVFAVATKVIDGSLRLKLVDMECKLGRVMEKCFAFNKLDRPDFSQLCNELQIEK
jgi:serine/threonine protein kinase